MPIGWNFPSNNYGTISGIGEAGIETFRGTPYRSLAREICQNSLDAKAFKDNPVLVQFSCFQVAPNDIPGFSALKEAIESCFVFWTKQGNKKTTDFFEKAVVITRQKTISVLQISDFNTTGLVGSDKDYNTPWQNLVKASGVSSKAGDSGGSFGIGKSAPFACSDLRTVFYSTHDENGLDASQGVAKLVSFPLKNGGPGRDADNIATGIGYYGEKEKNQAIHKCFSFGKEPSRNGRYGTDVFIVGFTNKAEWKNEIINSILDDFLVSIYSELLYVKVDDVAISKKTLPDLIQKYKNTAPAAYNYYQALISPDAHVINHNFGGLGNIELRILIQSGLHRRIFMGRNNGMKIFDQKNFPAAIEFSGICILKDEGINSYFREMENPQHNAWEPERHNRPTEAKRRKQELSRYIKETLLEYGRITTIAEVDAEGVGDYLPDDTTSGSGPDKKESIVDATKTFDLNLSTFKPVQSIPEVLFSKDGIQEDDGIGEPDEKGFGGSGSKDYGDGIRNQDGEGTNFGGEEGDAPGKNGVGPYSYDKGTETPDSTKNVRRKFEIHTLFVRLIQIDAAKQRYRLIFTPTKTVGEGYLQLKLSGEQSNIAVNISRAVDCVTSKTLQTKQNIIYLAGIAKNVKMSVEFDVDYTEQSSMEVSLYGYKV